MVLGWRKLRGNNSGHFLVWDVTGSWKDGKAGGFRAVDPCTAECAVLRQSGPGMKKFIADNIIGKASYLRSQTRILKMIRLCPQRLGNSKFAKSSERIELCNCEAKQAHRH
jgi:hypothetical protein